MLFNNIVAPAPGFVHVPVGKVGDYPVGLNGNEAPPQQVTADVTSPGATIRDRFKL